MVRNIEKLVKIECIKEKTEKKLDSVKAFATIPTLNLMNIEPYSESGIPVHFDLGLDQLEEQEE
jgi:hypothetical protein